MLYFLDCWNIEPDNRPTIDQVVTRIKEIIEKEGDFHQYEINTDLQLLNKQLVSNTAEISENIINNSFDNIAIKEIDSSVSSSKQIINKPISTENNFAIIVDEIINIFIGVGYD